MKCKKKRAGELIRIINILNDCLYDLKKVINKERAYREMIPEELRDTSYAKSLFELMFNLEGALYQIADSKETIRRYHNLRIE